jgi:DNA polymerase-3 subunit gamma/tau
MNIRPSLSGEAVFTVTIDNKIVAQELRAMQSRIESYLKQQMQNSRITMEVVLEETQKVHHIYSRVEQYQQLEQSNPALKKLKEMFELDLE